MLAVSRQALRPLPIALAVCCLLSLSACDTVSVSSVEVGDVEVAPPSAVVPEGGSVQFTASVLDLSGKVLAGRAVTWRSNAPSIATVDQDGMVQGVSFGTAAITASAGGEVGSAVALVGQPPRIRIDPVSLTFDGVEGQTAGAKTVSITNVGELPLEDLSAEITYTSAETGWLQTSLDRTTAPATLTVRASAAGLIRGTYTASVAVAGPLADNSPVHLPVTFTVQSSGPEIVAAPNPVQLSKASPQKVVNVTNGGAGALTGLSVSVSYEGRSGWLAASLSKDSAPATLTLSAAVGGLPDGTYNATVEIGSSNPGVDPITIPVTLSMAPLPPSLVVDPLQVNLAAAVNASTPAETDVAITNGGGGTLSGLVRSIRYGAGQPTGWLGATLSSTVAPATMTVFATPTGLAQGNYAAVIEVAGNASDSPRLVQVSFTVLPPPPTPPNTPTGLAVTVVGPNQLDLAWADAGGNETEFRVERRLQGGTWGQIATTSANTATYSDTAVDDGETYEYRVRACNDAGCSGFSAVASGMTPELPPTAPSSLSAVAQDTDEVRLTWTDESDNEANFELERSADGGVTWSVVASPGANTTEYRDEGVASGTDYSYRIRACNTSGCSAWSNVVAVSTPDAIPATPQGLNVEVLSAVEVELTWTDASANESNFVVERRRNGTSWQEVATLPANTTTYRDTGLWVGTTYRYRVKACNVEGCSQPTPDVRITTQNPTSVPTAPASLAVDDVQSNAVHLSWTDTSDNEVLFLVQRSTGAFGPWGDLEEVGVNVDSYSDTTVSASQIYNYRIFACNNLGCSPRSNVVQVLVPPS